MARRKLEWTMFSDADLSLAWNLVGVISIELAEQVNWQVLLFVQINSSARKRVVGEKIIHAN